MANKEYTPTINLELPKREEHFNIGTFNTNASNIDTAFKRTPIISFSETAPDSPKQYDIWYEIEGASTDSEGNVYKIIKDIKMYDIFTNEENVQIEEWVSFKTNKETVEGKLVTQADFDDYKTNALKDQIKLVLSDEAAITPVFG